MALSRGEAARLELDEANRLWGYPTTDEELVILSEWTEESEAAWVFTYSTCTFARTGDVTRAIGIDTEPIVVAKATGEVCSMPGSTAAARLWQPWSRSGAAVGRRGGEPNPPLRQTAAAFAIPRLQAHTGCCCC